MTHSFARTAILLLGTVACGISVTGCRPQQIGDKPGDEMNHALTAQQKAAIAEHKQKGEQ